MLGYFPVPYEDELLYSVVARYALHTGLKGNQKTVIREVFSSSTATAVPDLPSHIDALVQNLQQVWQISAVDLIRDYTFAPIYLPFLSENQAKTTLASMRSNSGGSIHTRTGIAASSVKQPVYFRYCPECIKEQKDQDGEQYWVRVHQLPGLQFCLHHQCQLECSDFHFHVREKHLFVAASDIQEAKSTTPWAVRESEAIFYALYTELSRSKLIEGLGFNRWSLFYRALALKLGLMQGTRVKHLEIHQILQNAWRGTSYEQFFIDSPGSDWLTNLFRKHRKSFHPLKHLLVLSVLLPGKAIGEILKEVSRLPSTPPHNTSVKTINPVTLSGVETHRSTWNELLRKNPKLGIKELRKIPYGGATYAWLYRHDRQWLMANRPYRKRVGIGHYATDYEAWDDDNLIQLNLALKSLLIQLKW